MNALSIILQKHMNISNPIIYEKCGSWVFWQEYYKIIESSTNAPYRNIMGYIMNYISFTCSYLVNNPDANTKDCTREKFSNLFNILTNPFFSKEITDEIMVLFMKSQRTYYAFQKLALIFKHKNMEAHVYHDLCMNKIEEKSRCVFSMIQNNTKYYFLISDLMGIIRRALLHESYFFAKPLEPKNPYNNLPFTHSDLYNIYFYMKKHYMIIPSIFQSFFMSNFDFDQFVNNNEQLIREETIHNYAFTTPYTSLMVDLPKMFSINKLASRRLTISNAFPKDKLVDIFRPYLHLYYLHRYGITGTENKNQALGLLKKKLRRFVNFNQAFGRSIIRLKRINGFGVKMKKIKHYEINMSYISFNNDDKDPNSVDYLKINKEDYDSGNMDIIVNEQPIRSNQSRLISNSRMLNVLSNIIESRRGAIISNEDNDNNTQDSYTDSDDEINIIINHTNQNNDDEESDEIEDVGNLSNDEISSVENIDTEESNNSSNSNNTMIDILNDDFIPFSDSQTNTQLDTNIVTNNESIQNDITTIQNENESDEESIGFVIDRQGYRELLQTLEDNDSNNATTSRDSTLFEEEIVRINDEYQHMYLDSVSEYDDYENNDIDSIS